jgi:hypothetical protein
MRKKRLVLVATLFVGVSGFLGWLLLRPHEPVYQGKTLTAWLDQYGSNQWIFRNPDSHPPKGDPEAESAIRHIGANLIPVYLNMISTRSSSFKTNLLGRIPNSWRVRLHFPSVLEYEQKLAVRRNRGAFGLVALGVDAKPAVPALIVLLTDRNSDVRLCSIAALLHLSSIARDAVPALISCLNNPDKNMWSYALDALGDIRADPDHSIPAVLDFFDKNPGNFPMRYKAVHCLCQFQAQAIPVLLKLLDDPNADIRKSVISELGKIRAQPDLVIPALVASLNREREKHAYYNVLAVCDALRQYGPEASSAVPTLLKFAGDNGGDFQVHAIWALRAIDKDAAIRAGLPPLEHN